MKKILLCVGLVIMVAIAGIIYWTYQHTRGTALQVVSQENGQSTSTVLGKFSKTPFSQIEIPTNWITYTSEAYGFEIKLPPKWTVEHELNNLYISDDKSKLVFVIATHPADSLESWMEYNTNDPYSTSTVPVTYTNVNINGMSAREMHSSSSCRKDRSVVIYRDNIIFNLLTIEACDYNQDTSAIFSSFKFIGKSKVIPFEY